MVLNGSRRFLVVAISEEFQSSLYYIDEHTAR